METKQKKKNILVICIILAVLFIFVFILFNTGGWEYELGIISYDDELPHYFLTSDTTVYNLTDEDFDQYPLIKKLIEKNPSLVIVTDNPFVRLRYESVFEFITTKEADILISIYGNDDDTSIPKRFLWYNNSYYQLSIIWN